MRRILRWTLGALAALVAAAGLAVGGGLLYANHQLGKRWDVPAPAIRAATDAAAVARGEQLFRAICADCHAPGSRAVGKFMPDVPAFLGRFYPPNVTAHREAGVGAWTDGELARVIRSGVRRDGRAATVMPLFAGLSDEDLAGILGFMRSGDPMFAPDATVQPPSEPAFAGKLILTFVVGVDPKPSPPRVTAPSRGASAEYGRYLTLEVLQCGDCHTAGFAPDKTRAPGAFAGGFELTDAAVRPIVAPNITPDDDTGIGRWSGADFVRAVRDGVRPDGSPIHPPMPLLRTLDEQDLLAVHAFLRTVAAVRSAHPRPASVPAAAPVAAVTSEGAALFARHGCVACHGEGAPFRDRLRPCAARPVDEVAARIRNPERFAQNAQMPTFAEVIDEAAARELAAYTQELARTLPAR
jgi:mono/diheme cytochrome c family protein